MINCSYHQLCCLREPLIALLIFSMSRLYANFESHFSRTHPKHHPTILEKKSGFFFFIKRLATPPRVVSLRCCESQNAVKLEWMFFLAHSASSAAYTTEIFLISFGSNLSNRGDKRIYFSKILFDIKTRSVWNFHRKSAAKVKVFVFDNPQLLRCCRCFCCQLRCVCKGSVSHFWVGQAKPEQTRIFPCKKAIKRILVTCLSVQPVVGCNIAHTDSQFVYPRNVGSRKSFQNALSCYRLAGKLMSMYIATRHATNSRRISL